MRQCITLLPYSCLWWLTDWLGRAMPHAVSHRLLTAEARVRILTVHMGFVVDKVALGRCSELSSSLMMEAVRTSETSVDNNSTRQYIPEDNSEHHTRRRENLKSHIALGRILSWLLRVSVLSIIRPLFRICPCIIWSHPHSLVPPRDTLILSSGLIRGLRCDRLLKWFPCQNTVCSVPVPTALADLCSALNCPLTFPFLGRNTSRRTLYLDTCTLCSSLKDRDCCSHSYRTTYRIADYIDYGHVSWFVIFWNVDVITAKEVLFSSAEQCKKFSYKFRSKDVISGPICKMCIILFIIRYSSAVNRPLNWYTPAYRG
jgi:hypothetical protein